MRIDAHILTCPERAAVLRNTLANLRATDWGVEPAVLVNRDAHPDRRVRIQRGTRAVLERALASGAEWSLHLEDDLVFNRHLRENLQHWTPLRTASVDQPFFASLFRAPGLPPQEERVGSHTALVPAARAYGNQALLLSRGTVRHILSHWDEEALEADHKLARLAGRLGPLLLHLPSLVQHVGRTSAWGGRFFQSADFVPDWRAAGGMDWAPLTETSARAAMGAFVDQLPPEPGGFSGTGVVIAAGGLHYLVNAWVAVRLLREQGCRLPIQIWHLGPDEMPEPLAGLFHDQGVECIDAHTRLAQHPARQLDGWALKAYAILASSFRHVLLLDADNAPTADPTYLFDSAPYQSTGAIFWPDQAEGVGHPGSLLQANHPIWRLTGLPYRGDPSFESGQICVDKQRCWRELKLAMWMNEHADFWYRFLYGDKDTFQIAWRKLDTPWAMPARRPLMPDRRVFCQVDFDGRVIFQHRFGDKWRLDGRNPRLEGFAHEEQCRQAVAELRQQLLPALGVGDRRTRLAPGRWLWSRQGRPPRLLSFHPDGFVDAGRDRSVRLWKIAADTLLLIGDNLQTHARFRHVPRAQAWLGLGEPGASLARA